MPLPAAASPGDEFAYGNQHGLIGRDGCAGRGRGRHALKLSMAGLELVLGSSAQEHADAGAPLCLALRAAWETAAWEAAGYCCSRSLASQYSRWF